MRSRGRRFPVQRRDLTPVHALNGTQRRLAVAHSPAASDRATAMFTAAATLSDDEAAATLMAHLDRPALARPRLLRFAATGRRSNSGTKTHHSGPGQRFVQPLESTSIHLIQSGLMRLAAIFPDRSFDPADAAEYNRLQISTSSTIRDFVTLHYHATNATITHCGDTAVDMPIPEHSSTASTCSQQRAGGVLRYRAVRGAQLALTVDRPALLAAALDPSPIFSSCGTRRQLAR